MTTRQHSRSAPLKQRNAQSSPLPLRIALWIVTALLAIPVIAVIFLLTFDWNRARPRLNNKAGAF